MIEVHLMPDAFTAGECERIITITAGMPADDAKVVGRQRDHNIRQAELVWLDDVDGIGWVMDRLIELVRRSNRDLFDFDLRAFSESPQVARYKASNGGHFAWHSDIGDRPNAANRKLTLVLQLSKPNNYEGGDLEVMQRARVVTASRTQGCVTVFPSFSLHHVTPVTSGVRHSLTVWAHGPAFR
jgi:PKHD-type hydroxylase